MLGVHGTGVRLGVRGFMECHCVNCDPPHVENLFGGVYPLDLFAWPFVQKYPYSGCSGSPAFVLREHGLEEWEVEDVIYLSNRMRAVGR